MVSAWESTMPTTSENNTMKPHEKGFFKSDFLVSLIKILLFYTVAGSLAAANVPASEVGSTKRKWSGKISNDTV